MNDEFGRMVGDLLLKEFARELRSSCRLSNLVARWAGDTFLVVLDAAENTALEQAERLRSWVSRQYLFPAGPVMQASDWMHRLVVLNIAKATPYRQFWSAQMPLCARGAIRLCNEEPPEQAPSKWGTRRLSCFVLALAGVSVSAITRSTSRFLSRESHNLPTHSEIPLVPPLLQS